MDATVYHLRVPSEFLRTATWIKLEEPQSFQPLYVEMLFAEGLAIGGGVLAALVHWMLGLVAVVVAGAWARRLGGKAIWGAVSFGVTALFAWEATSAFIDLGLALFSALAFFWATRPERSWRANILAGVYGGFAAGSKFTGIVAAGLAGCAGLAILWPEWRRGVGRLATIGGIAVAVACPWYLRNFMFTGNPIFPLANRSFHLPAVPLSAMSYGLGSDLGHLLSSPFDLIARGDLFDQGWSVGPTFLAFVPLGLLVRRTRLSLVVGVCIAVWWLIWFYSSPQTRLLLPIMPMAAGVAGVGLTVLLATPERTGRRGMALAALAVAAIGAVGTAALAARQEMKVIRGGEAPASYLERTSWNYIAYERGNHLLPVDAKLASTGMGNNLYYLERSAVWLGKERRSTLELRRQGFTHELEISSCPLPSLDADDRLTLAAGTYALPASRLSGGIYLQVCYRLSTVGHPPPRG